MSPPRGTYGPTCTPRTAARWPKNYRIPPTHRGDSWPTGGPPGSGVRSHRVRYESIVPESSAETTVSIGMPAGYNCSFVRPTARVLALRCSPGCLPRPDGVLNRSKYSRDTELWPTYDPYKMPQNDLFCWQKCLFLAVLAPVHAPTVVPGQSRA